MNENNQNKEGGNSPKKNYTALLITLIFTLFIVGAMHSWWQQSRSEQIPYSEFNQMLKDHEIESVVVSGSKITITPKKGSKLEEVRHRQGPGRRRSHGRGVLYRADVRPGPAEQAG